MPPKFPDAPRSRCLPFDAYSASLETGNWSLYTYNGQPRRSFDVTSRSCSRGLLRYNVSQVERCLANKHVLMVGDSVTRHQMEALTVLLETGQYVHPVMRAARVAPMTDGIMKEPQDDRSFGCGDVIRCDFNKDTQQTEYYRINLYYHNARHNINVTHLGLYKFGRGRTPTGWYPPEQQVDFDDAAPGGWQGLRLDELASIARREVGTVDVLQLNAGLWMAHDSWPRENAVPWQKTFVDGDVDAAVLNLTLWESVVKRGAVSCSGALRPLWCWLGHGVLPGSSIGVTSWRCMT